jgi:diacylglycerol kinase (ATP)
MASNGSFRALVIVNPASAAGATRRRWHRIARAIRRALGPFEHVFSEAPHHATALARRALEAGVEMVVAVGGDGTVNEVARGFFDGGRPVAPHAALGVVPHGTGGDLARSLGTPGFEEACARLHGHSTLPIDVGLARFADHDGQPAEREFLNAASFGCSGVVARALAGTPKQLGSLAFTLATVRALRGYRDQAVTITINGGPPEDLAITNCAVCNGRYFGGGMQVAPSARIDDGWLDVTTWAGFGLAGFVRHRRALYDGTHVHLPGTRLDRTRTITATSPAEVLLELDGESVGRLPVSINLLPGALRLKV